MKLTSVTYPFIVLLLVCTAAGIIGQRKLDGQTRYDTTDGFFVANFGLSIGPFRNVNIFSPAPYQIGFGSGTAGDRSATILAGYVDVNPGAYTFKGNKGSISNPSSGIISLDGTTIGDRAAIVTAGYYDAQSLFSQGAGAHNGMTGSIGCHLTTISVRNAANTGTQSLTYCDSLTNNSVWGGIVAP